MKRRNFLVHASTAVSGLALSRPVSADWPLGSNSSGSGLLTAWNGVLTAAIATNRLGPTVAARALSMVYEAVYNAWAAYDKRADFSLSGLRKRPKTEWLTANKAIAVSQAAYTVLVDLFPAQTPAFDNTLADLTAGLPVGLPSGVAALMGGQLAGSVLLLARDGDGSNQRGDLAPGAYADWTGYQPINSADVLVDPTRWQPLRVTVAGVTSVQRFLSPHWGQVRPFALASGSALRPAFSNPAPTMGEMQQLIDYSADLSDADKVLVDFFANNPGSVSPPGQWAKIADIVSAIDGNSIDDDVKLFFALGQAMLDASIAAWDAKRAYDSARPITAIRYYFRGQTILSWLGEGQGAGWIQGENWRPYQRITNPTPPFPEFLSGHSTFSAAAARVIAGLRGDAIDLSFTFPAGGVPFDPTVPAAPVLLRWDSLAAVADDAGLSRRLGGIHFKRGDLRGRHLGRKVGSAVLARCADLFDDGLRSH